MHLVGGLQISFKINQQEKGYQTKITEVHGNGSLSVHRADPNISVRVLQKCCTCTFHFDFVSVIFFFLSFFHLFFTNIKTVDFMIWCAGGLSVDNDNSKTHTINKQEMK